MFKIQGNVVMIGETVQVTEKFVKREFVIEDTSSMYPQQIIFQLAQDKTKFIDGIAEGEWIEVSFNIRGRAWESPQGETKYFNTLDAWRVEKVQGMQHQPPTQSAPPQSAPSTTNNETTTDTGDDDDDLPF